MSLGRMDNHQAHYQHPAPVIHSLRWIQYALPKKMVFDWEEGFCSVMPEDDDETVTMEEYWRLRGT